MNHSSLILQEAHLAALSQHLLREDGKERAAYVLFGRSYIETDPWDSTPRVKFLSHEVIPVEDSALLVSTPSQVTWATDSFVAALKNAQRKGLVVGIAHSHPSGYDQFSPTDDSNESDLARLASNRNGPKTQLISLLLFSSMAPPIGRIWHNPSTHEPLNPVCVIGSQFRFGLPNNNCDELTTTFHRQSLAFGRAFTSTLQQLRVGIVGCGGTGSAVALLSARLGVGRILLIDKDVVDHTNLNRLHGAMMSDAITQKPKVEVVARSIREMGLGSNVKTIQAWANDTRCRNLLKSCDVIFGCSDDNQGRLLLNRFAYYYLVPVIDMGLAIEVTKDDVPTIQALDGRVTVLYPSNTCLLCRGIVDTELARIEALRRTNPQEYERQKQEAYVRGEGEPNPAVVTFTTEVASMAVNELIHRLQGFRGPAGETAQRNRLFHRMHDLRPGDDPSPNCQICGTPRAWGRGDIEPFLDRIE